MTNVKICPQVGASWRWSRIFRGTLCEVWWNKMLRIPASITCYLNPTRTWVWDLSCSPPSIRRLLLSEAKRGGWYLPYMWLSCLRRFSTPALPSALILTQVRVKLMDAFLWLWCFFTISDVGGWNLDLFDAKPWHRCHMTVYIFVWYSHNIVIIINKVTLKLKPATYKLQHLNSMHSLATRGLKVVPALNLQYTLAAAYVHACAVRVCLDQSVHSYWLQHYRGDRSVWLCCLRPWCFRTIWMQRWIISSVLGWWDA